MMSKRKMFFNILFLVAVFSVTFYYIFHGQDMSYIIENIKSTDLRYWSLAVVCTIIFIGCESIIIYYLMKSIQQKVQLSHCFLYSFAGFFFSCITPSASGGQPAQVYLMKKDNISIPVATQVLMIVTITYKMVLVLLGATILIIRPAKVMSYLDPILGFCYLGLFLNIICVGFMLLLSFHPTMAQKQLRAIIRLFGKIRLIRRADYYLLKVEKAMEQYKDVAVYFKTHKIVIWNVLVISIVQRVILFLVTYLVYLAFGLSGTNFTTIIILQGMIAVAVDMLPLPGGMGISEKLFLQIFTPVFGSLTLPGMIVSRGLSYYTELIISALLTVVAFFTIGRKDRGKEDDRIL